LRPRLDAPGARPASAARRGAGAAPGDRVGARGGQAGRGAAEGARGLGRVKGGEGGRACVRKKRAVDSAALALARPLSLSRFVTPACRIASFAARAWEQAGCLWRPELKMHAPGSGQLGRLHGVFLSFSFSSASAEEKK
jgi:hypothetical protein